MKFLILILFLTFSYVFAQPTVQLSGNWVFHTGDNAAFAKPVFDDSKWETITVPSQWETQGYPNLDGFAWYRLHFTAQKNIKEKDLTILLGKIDDVDEVFLNGFRIGASGTFPPNPASEWNAQRVYTFNSSILKKENVLAVRVFDMGAPGGIIGGDFGIYTKKALQSYLNVDNRPVRSYHKLTTSNGLIAAVFDESLNSITGVYPHIFQMIDKTTPVKSYLNNLKISVTERPLKTYYLANTHIIISEYKKFNVYYYASFRADKPVFYVVAESKNHQNVKELDFIFKRSSRLLSDSITVFNAPYFRKVFLYSFEDSIRNNALSLHECRNSIKNQPSIIEDEAGFMLGVFSRCKLPEKISLKEKNVYQQAISVLKMSQVSQSEIFPRGRGQILASLPPGEWNISWIRDGSYSLSALVKLGLYEEAKNYINFILNADCGYYKTYKHTDGKDYGVGTDYSISVCRYFGNGTEESDFNAQGPNIELDGFGLFLKGFSEFINASKDTMMLFTNLKKIKNTVADVLLHVVDGNGLIRMESGPWERHLPGKQITYTSLTAAKGLFDFGHLLKTFKRADSQRYLETADALLDAIKKRLVVNGMIKGTFEAQKTSDIEYFDAATFEAFNFFPAEFKDLFSSHVKAYNLELSMGKNRGIKRINGGDWYDNQEWIFLDCRLIQAFQSNGMEKAANGLRNWIVAQAALNNNLIPELFAQANAKYEGAIPMVGFGAGSFILIYFK